MKIAVVAVLLFAVTPSLLNASCTDESCCYVHFNREVDRCKREYRNYIDTYCDRATSVCRCLLYPAVNPNCLFDCLDAGIDCYDAYYVAERIFDRCLDLAAMDLDYCQANMHECDIDVPGGL